MQAKLCQTKDLHTFVLLRVKVTKSVKGQNCFFVYHSALYYYIVKGRIKIFLRVTKLKTIVRQRKYISSFQIVIRKSVWQEFLLAYWSMKFLLQLSGMDYKMSQNLGLLTLMIRCKMKSRFLRSSSTEKLAPVYSKIQSIFQ